MIEPAGFIRDVIAKHLYAFLNTSINFQWIFDFHISNLAIHAETRGSVFIDLFGVWHFWVGVTADICGQVA